MYEYDLITASQSTENILVLSAVQTKRKRKRWV